MVGVLRWIQANVTGIFHRTVKFGEVVGLREGRLSADKTCRHVVICIFPADEHAGPAVRGLTHDRRVSKLLDQGLLALDGGIADLGRLG